MTRRITTIVFALSTAASSALAAHYSYRMVDLGTLGGHASGGEALNAAGDVVGWSIAGNGRYLAFISDGLVMDDLGTDSEGYSSGAHDVSDLGPLGRFVVGDLDLQLLGDTRPFVWNEGFITVLPTFGGRDGEARGVNSMGETVGWAELSGYGHAAFLWQGDALQELPGLAIDTPYDKAHAVNEAGVIVGESWDASSIRRAVIWSQGRVDRVLELLPSWTGAAAYDLNEAGEIVGKAWLAGNLSVPVRWDAQGPAALGRRSEDRYGSATGINDRGQAVGTTYHGGHSQGEGTYVSCSPSSCRQIPQSQPWWWAPVLIVGS